MTCFVPCIKDLRKPPVRLLEHSEDVVEVLRGDESLVFICIQTTSLSEDLSTPTCVVLRTSQTRDEIIIPGFDPGFVHLLLKDDGTPVREKSTSLVSESCPISLTELSPTSTTI